MGRQYGRNMLVHVILLGSSLPEGCPYREGLFEVELLLDCGERGPLRCLNVRFATDVLHPNFTRDMGICHCHPDFLPAWRRKSHRLWNILDDLHRRLHSPIVPLPHQIAVIQPRKQLSDVEVVKMRKELEKKEQTKTALALAIERSKMPTSSIQSLASIIKAQRTSQTWATKAKSTASLAGNVKQLHEEEDERPEDHRLAMPCGSRLELAAEFSHEAIQRRAARLCATELARRPQLRVRAADTALEKALFSDDPGAWQARTLKSLLALDRAWHTQEQAWTSREGGSTEWEPTVLEIHENVETLPALHRLTVSPFLSACDVRVERATEFIHPDDDAGLRRLDTSYESAQGLSDRPATIDLLLNRKADGSAELIIRPVRRKSSDAYGQPPRVLTWAEHDMDGYIVVVFSRTDLSIVSHKLFSRSHPWGMKKMLQHLLALDSSRLVVMYSPAWREMTTSNLTWLSMDEQRGATEHDATRAFFHCGAYHWLPANHPSMVKKNANMRQLEHLTLDKRLEEQRKALIAAQNRGWGSPPIKLPEKQMVRARTAVVLAPTSVAAYPALEGLAERAPERGAAT
jgi:ubiquitin-protein ligase